MKYDPENRLIKMKELRGQQYEQDRDQMIRGMQSTEAGRAHLSAFIAAKKKLGKLADGACYRMPLSKYKQYLEDGKK